MVKTEITNLVQGVSQQIDALKLPGQVRDQENMFPSTVEGLRKRPHTEHLSRFASLTLDRVLFHSIDRDSREQYLLTAGHETLAVNGVGGESVSIFGGINKVKNPNRVRSSDWTKTAQVGIISGQVRENAAEDPDGGMDAFLVERDATLGTTHVFQEFTDLVEGRDHLVQVKVKRASGTFDMALVVEQLGTATTSYVRVDPDTCSSTATLSVISSHVEDLEDGWCLIKFKFAYGVGGGTVRLSLVCVFDTLIFLTSQPGGIYFYDPQLADLTPDLSYLSIREPNRLSASDAENLTNGGWALTAQALATQSTSILSPFGIGTYDRVRRKSAAGSDTGGVEFTLGVWEKGRNTFSVFTRKENGGTDAPMLRIELRDSTGTTVNHTVEATWSGDVLGSPVCSADASCGIEDFGNGHYRIWLSVDTAEAANTSPGDVRRIVCFAKDNNLGPEVSALFWGAKVEAGVKDPTPYMDPERRLRALTVADYTFLSNGLVEVDSLTDKTEANPNVDEAFLFINQADYATQYRVKLRIGTSGYIRSVVVKNTALAQAVDVHRYEGIVASAGVWNVEVGGGPTIIGTYTAGGSDTAETIAEGLAKSVNETFPAAINNGADATAIGDAIELTFRRVVNQAPNLNTPAGLLPFTRQLHSRTDALERIDTDHFAARLAAQLNSIPGTTFIAKGSVIQGIGTSKFDEILIEDSNGDRNTTRVWQEIDNFDELPLVCRDGFSIKVTGIPEEAIDDYWVKFEAEVPGAFGSGVWRESVEPGISFRLDPYTLPHALVRREDDSSGTVTGRPLELYFDYTQPAWNERGVGDLKTNKDPSFIGEQIRGMFLWQSRLGFLAGQSVVFSETSRFFNFFRTTTLDLPASERIDLISGHSEISLFNHAQAIDEELMLFTDRTQFVVTGDPLTPETAALVPKVSEENLVTPMPASTGSTILMAAQTGQHSAVLEILRLGDQEFDAADTTLAVTKYLPGKIVSISVSKAENFGCFLADGDRSSLFVYKYQWVGQQKIQSAWSKYTFGDSRILGHAFIRSVLYLLLERDGETFLESMEVGDGLGFTLLLDRRVASDDPGVSVALVSSDTEWTLPYDLAAGETYEVWTQQGVQLPVIATGTNTVRVDGDETLTPVVIGQRFTSSVELPRPVIPREGQGHAVPRLGSKLNTVNALIESQDGTLYDISIGRGTGRDPESYAATVGSPGVYNAMIGMPQDNFTLTLSNPYAGSVGFVKVEYENEYDSMSGYL